MYVPAPPKILWMLAAGGYMYTILIRRGKRANSRMDAVEKLKVGPASHIL
jgi:hypothetical protein